MDTVRPGQTRRLLGHVLLMVGGAVCLAVAVGLAPHLVKDGLNATSIVALAAALVGLTLLAIGSRAVWRSRGPLGRLLLVPFVVVLVATAALTLGQAVGATVVPRPSVGAQSPAAVGLRHESVELTTVDGERLAGWYVPSSNGAAVVLRHGAGSTRSSVLAHASVLAGRGYGVLLVDARGHGGSSGRAMDFGWYGDLDTRAAVDLLTRTPDVTGGRIGVVGLSMGGEEAIGAMGADERIRAVVAEGATNRVAGDKAWLPDAFGLRGVMQQQLDRLTYGATDLLTPAAPPPTLRESAARAAPRPLLLIASAEQSEEEAAARFIAGGSPTSVTVWVAPGGHIGALGAAEAEWERRVGAFLDAALGVAG